MTWFAWALGASLLIVAIIVLVQWRRRKQWWWGIAGALFLFLGLASLAIGWQDWPVQTATRFSALAHHGQVKELNRYLPESSKWQIRQDGAITIRAENGDVMTLLPENLPLNTFESNPIESKGLPSSERWAGRYSFALATQGRPTYTIYCTAKYGKVYCRRIERVVEQK